MEIPKEYKARISKLSEKLGKSTTELEKELEEAFKFVGTTTKTTDKKKWDLAWSRFWGGYRRTTGSIFSPAPLWTGMIFGDSGLKDFIEIMKRSAEYKYNNVKTRQKAIEDNLVSRDGTPLDQREKINYGKDENPNYLKPYPKDAHSYYRAVYGVCSKGGEINMEDLQFFRLNINDEEAINISYPPRTLVQFRGNVKKNSAYTFLDLNAIGDKEVVFSTVKGDVGDIVESLAASKWAVHKIEDVIHLYGMYKDDKSVPLLLFANVGTINKDINEKTGNRTLWLDDDDVDFDKPGMTAFLPGNMRIEFGLDSKVLFVGRIDRLGEEGLDERYVFQIYGYYAPPEYLLPVTEKYEYKEHKVP